MTYQDFFDFETVINMKLAFKKKVEDKAFLKASQIIVTKDYPEGYILKSAFNMQDSDGQKVIAVHPKASKFEFDLGKVSLPIMYPHERKINSIKLHR